MTLTALSPTQPGAHHTTAPRTPAPAVSASIGASIGARADAGAATVASLAPAFARQREAMQPCRDLMGGTPAMRVAGERYIERGDASPAAFQSRLARTVLFNAYRRTLNFLRGQVFQSPVTIGSASDPLAPADMDRFLAWAEDVDLRGANLTSWSGAVFRQGVQDGVTFAVIDHSAVETRTTPTGTEYRRADGSWAKKTRAADRCEGWRPYLVHIDAANVLDARGSWCNGRYVIDHFRYQEVVTEPHGQWGQRDVRQIRVFQREADGTVRWSLWRAGEGGQFVPHSQGALTIPEIPVAVFMPGDARSPWTAEPALIDLAWLNVRHWQVSGGHAELMEYVQRPVWFCSGTDLADESGEPLAFGAGRLIITPNAATLRNVGVDPASCQASRAELVALEETMALYGLQLLQARQTTTTATEVTRTSEENNSTLAAWALTFQDFLENCLRLVALWHTLPDGPSISLKSPATPDLRLLLDMQRQGVLPPETVLAAARANGLVPE